MEINLENRVQVPEWIRKRDIGPAPYETLQYLVGSDTIYVHKWMWSNLEGRDIGTPETVRRIMLSALINSEVHCLLPPNSGSYWGTGVDREKVKEGLKNLWRGSLWDLRKFTSAAYLLGTDFSQPGSDPESFNPLKALKIRHDNDGRDQLEGELKRFYAQEKGIDNPKSVTVDSDVIRQYCNRHGLRKFESAFSARLALR